MRFSFFLIIALSCLLWCSSCSRTPQKHYAAAKAWGGYHATKAPAPVAAASVPGPHLPEEQQPEEEISHPGSTALAGISPVATAAQASQKPSVSQARKPQAKLARTKAQFMPQQALGTRKLSPLAALSLVCAILAYIPYLSTLSLFISLPFAVAGFFLGRKGIKQVREQFMRYYGGGVARAGMIGSLIIGVVVLFLLLMGLIL